MFFFSIEETQRNTISFNKQLELSAYPTTNDAEHTTERPLTTLQSRIASVLETAGASSPVFSSVFSSQTNLSQMKVMHSVEMFPNHQSDQKWA